MTLASALDGSVVARLRVGGECLLAVEAPAAPRGDEQPEATAMAELAWIAGLPDPVATLDVEAGDLPPRVRIPLTDALLETVRHTGDFARVESLMGNLDDVLASVPDPFVRFSERALGPGEAFLLSRVDQPMKIADVIDESGMDREQAIRCICGLRFAGALEARAPSSAWAGDANPFDVPAAPAPGQPGGATLSADAAELAQVCYLVEEKLRSVEGGADHYAVLEVERRASIDRIKASYRELAKKYHPDRHAELAAFDADIKSRLEKIFTALTTAYSALGNPKEREAYDAKLQKAEHAAAVKAPRAEPPAIPKPKPPPKPAEPPPPAAARESAPVKPPVPIPVVPPLPSRPPKRPVSAQKPAASSESTPRVPPGPVPAAAHEHAPAAAAPSAPASPAPVAKPSVKPDALYDHGRAYLESGDWDRAAQAFKRGLDAVPDDGRMHAGLGTALAESHGLTKLAEASLRKAVELDAGSAERFVEIAQVYQKFERPDEARTLFKRAVLIDPENDVARAALLELGVPVLSREPKPGFFKRLFRKS